MRNNKKNLLEIERSVAEFAYASVCSTKTYIQEKNLVKKEVAKGQNRRFFS